MSDPAHHIAWKAERLAELTATDGWLNLTDRLEFAPGRHRVGKDAQNDLVLSCGPDHLGVLDLDTAGARFTTPGGQPQPFQATDGFPQLAVPPFLLELHTVAGQPALRVRDLTLTPKIDLTYFPYDPAWAILADWQALPAATALTIGQKGAADTEVSVTHQAIFTHAGQTVTLLPTHWKAGKPQFVFRDQTSGRQTYAASRFLYGQLTPDGVLLDFNRAFSPPCAFTDFAICPLPPPENRLAFAVTAGELAP